MVTASMLHRAILGSFERFIGILIENYAGDFPFWLAPEQIRILPVSNEAREFAEHVQRKLFEGGVSSTLDSSGERLGKLIRNGEKSKIPVLAVIGAKETQNSSVSLRRIPAVAQPYLPTSPHLDHPLSPVYRP